MDPQPDITARFEREILPHLDAAYHLALWLTASEHDARDVVQEATLRAFRFFSGFRSGSARAWLLSIVRNTSHTWLQRHRNPASFVEFDEELHDLPDPGLAPDAQLLQQASIEAVHEAIIRLPVEFREVIILREMEDCSYKEIAEIAGIPVGTVMSRLARGRRQLCEALATHPARGGQP